ncbi:hypothetical protein D918_10031 [Trichuris suis]|nr:hypothetical protein D918_10031 [Trichuris suis]
MPAVVTFIQHFMPYLQDAFVLRTDHGSLQWLQSFKDADGQWARWQHKLQRFRFKITHRPGKRHGNADSLSRTVCKQCGREDEGLLNDEQPDSCGINSIQFTDGDSAKEQQQNDPDIAPLLVAKQSNDLALLPKQRTKALSMLIANWNRLHVRNGILWREWYETDGSSRLQFVVPKQMVPQLLHLCHSAPTAGHLGEEKMLWRLRERFYWPGYRSDMKRYIRTCWNAIREVALYARDAHCYSLR